MLFHIRRQRGGHDDRRSEHVADGAATLSAAGQRQERHREEGGAHGRGSLSIPPFRYHAGVRILLTGLLAISAGCAKDRLPPDPWADLVDSGAGGQGEERGGPSGTACPEGGDPLDCPSKGPGRAVPWGIHLPSGATAGERLAVQDVAALLGQMAGEVLEITPGASAACAPGSLQIQMLAAASDGTVEPARPAGPEEFRFSELPCDDGVLVTFSGTGQLQRQHAAYAWLHRLGVRFFHPEQTYVPEQPAWGDGPRSRTVRPAFRWRGVRPELSHPIELGDASDAERRSYARWQVANGATLAVFAQGVERGLARSAQFHLHRSTPGSPAALDPADGRSEDEQIRGALEPLLSKGPKIVDFTFDGPGPVPGPGEASDVDVVRQMTLIADHIRAEHPDTIVLTSNRGVATGDAPEFGVRYFDLPKFAPPELGVKLRPHMFFDLFRPAPVYGNEDNSALLAFMEEQAPTRRIWHAPEASWWRTFDIAVPLYLPITMDARSRDIRGISELLAAGLDGHEVVGSGHEWGYWQNEWCSLRLSVDPDYGLQGCLIDLTSPMGPAGDEVRRVLIDAISIQERDLVLGDLLKWFVGTDPELEVAAEAGLKFHPVPPPPGSVAAWSDEELRTWHDETVPALAQSATDYSALVLRLHDLQELVPERARPWFDEIRDGLTVTGLRASHALAAYGALVLAAQADREGDESLRRGASLRLARARLDTDLARAVIAEREAAYRYGPLERSIGGGPGGDADDNWTSYDYRYLNRTHLAYYWVRLDDRVAELIEGDEEVVQVADVVVEVGQEFALTVADPSLSDLAVEFGDGAAAQGRDHAHPYAASGIYPVRVTGQRRSGPWEFTADVAVVPQEWSSGAPNVVEPVGAELLTPLLPGIVFGDLPEGGLALGFDSDDDGRIPVGAWRPLTWALDPEGVATDASAPALVVLPMIDAGTGATIATLPVEGAVFGRPPVEGGGVASLVGGLKTQALVEAVVGVGEFDEEGARAAVATALGFTPETLPDSTALRVEWAMPPDPGQ